MSDITKLLIGVLIFSLGMLSIISLITGFNGTVPDNLPGSEAGTELVENVIGTSGSGGYAGQLTDVTEESSNLAGVANLLKLIKVVLLDAPTFAWQTWAETLVYLGVPLQAVGYVQSIILIIVVVAGILWFRGIR